MRQFTHINAQTLEEAVAVLAKYKSKAKIVSGGTDLIGEMKDNILPDYPEVVVNIKSIPGLDFIRDENQKLVIGALTRLEDIAGSLNVRQKMPILAQAAGETASPHIREMGTIAGNISQANRCWYYWVPENRFYCMRKGGKNCYALTGDGRYHSILGGVRVNKTPCSTGCPSGINIPDYIGKIREADIDEAARILMLNNPLPAMTGRVCPHYCESECNRQETDAAVSIRGIERYIGDYVLEHPGAGYNRPENELNKRIAIIGSGPSGLSAAYYLRTIGYDVTVFESMPEIGGLLVYGIPAYRLPKEKVKTQVQVLVDMGIHFKTGVRVGVDIKMNQLLSSYDAVYAACGAWKERASGMKGEEFTLSGAQFLRKANVGQPVLPGKKIAVIGGGNVAIDVARTLLRLGAEPVIIYRRGKAEMPALKDEVQKAQEEGIEIRFLTLQVEVSRQGDKMALTCQRMELGPIDSSGRPRPVPVKGSELVTEYDAVMTAIGEESDFSMIPTEFIGENGRIKVDDSTCTVGKNLFAGGDFVSGPSTVTEAIAAGRKASVSINAFLNGPKPSVDTGDSTCGSCNQPQIFNSAFLNPTPRNQGVELGVSARLSGLNTEETGGLDYSGVQNEANRCLNCSCVAVNPSDMAPVLIVLNASIITTKRSINADCYFTAGVNKSTILDDDEIVKEIEIPAVNISTEAVFTKFALRKSIDFPVVNCAAAIEFEKGVVKSARICLNSVFNSPYRVNAAEQMIVGKTIDNDLAEKAGQAGLAQAFPLVNNQSKIVIAGTLVKRAILECSKMSKLK